MCPACVAKLLLVCCEYWLRLSSALAIFLALAFLQHLAHCLRKRPTRLALFAQTLDTRRVSHVRRCRAPPFTRPRVPPYWLPRPATSSAKLLLKIPKVTELEVTEGRVARETHTPARAAAPRHPVTPSPRLSFTFCKKEDKRDGRYLVKLLECVLGTYSSSLLLF